MGNSLTNATPPLPYDRKIYASLIKYSEIKKTFSSFIVYSFSVGSGRYQWKIQKRFHEFKVLNKYLQKKYPNTMNAISLPSSNRFSQSADGLTKRGTDLAIWIEFITFNDLIFDDKEVKIFLEIGAVRPSPFPSLDSLSSPLFLPR
jgi:hypothetical protein